MKAFASRATRHFAPVSMPEISKKLINRIIAKATSINLLRTINFINNQPVAETRTSRFAGFSNWIWQQYSNIFETHERVEGKPTSVTACF